MTGEVSDTGSAHWASSFYLYIYTFTVPTMYTWAVYSMW